jgi:hypothetical protein
MRTKEQAPLRAAPFKPGDLMDAVIDEDIVEARDLLVLCQTKEQVDDVDSEGRTTLMVAARGNGTGGRMYADLLAMIWGRCKALGCDKKNILLEKGGRQNWIILMHAARCGHKENLRQVISFYEETFDKINNPDIQAGIDQIDVDCNVKSIIDQRIFGGEAGMISNNSGAACTTTGTPSTQARRSSRFAKRILPSLQRKKRATQFIYGTESEPTESESTTRFDLEPVVVNDGAATTSASPTQARCSSKFAKRIIISPSPFKNKGVPHSAPATESRSTASVQLKSFEDISNYSGAAGGFTRPTQARHSSRFAKRISPSPSIKKEGAPHSTPKTGSKSTGSVDLESAEVKEQPIDNVDEGQKQPAAKRKHSSSQSEITDDPSRLHPRPRHEQKTASRRQGFPPTIKAEDSVAMSEATSEEESRLNKITQWLAQVIGYDPNMEEMRAYANLFYDSGLHSVEAIKHRMTKPDLNLKEFAAIKRFHKIPILKELKDC